MSKRKPQRARPTKGTPPAGKNAVGPVSKRAAEPAGLRVARNLYQCGRYDEALRKFDELVRQSPNDIRLLIEPARAHAGRHHHSRCHALLERALRLAPRRHDIQFLVGESYRMLGAASEAERCFRKACLLAEGFVPAQVEL
ncbi:MAG: tetratricopeptide repeat protein, partial [Planctomycetales bacterium]|nr:tetratricopeptide repeat protein [Planctomycetales bacterium]